MPQKVCLPHPLSSWSESDSWLQAWVTTPSYVALRALVGLLPWLTVLFTVGPSRPPGKTRGTVLVKRSGWRLHSRSFARPSLTESPRLGYTLRRCWAGSVHWECTESSFLWVTPHFCKEWRKGKVLKECGLQPELGHVQPMGKQNRQRGKIINLAPR